MAKNESKGYDSSIADKANAPLAINLRELISNERSNDLAAYLNCSVQAINQYKQGTAFPKMENLIKIAKFCDCSIDFLLGITTTKTRDTDLQNVCSFTGLSEQAVSNLHSWAGNNQHRGAISKILTSPHFLDALRYLEMACALQNKLTDVPDETKGAVDYLNYLSATHEHGGGNIELAPSDKVKFCRQETVDILSDIIKDIIGKEGADNG